MRGVQTKLDVRGRTSYSGERIARLENNTMITEFKGKYKFLSNFEPVEIILDGVKYPSVEHAYMSAKCENSAWKEFCSDPVNTAGGVKRKGKTIPLRDDWEDVKLSVMEECLREKFLRDPFKTLLLETKDMHIQEGNYWNDTFWGVCLKTNTGENNLGKLLMQIRKDIFRIKESFGELT